MAHVIELCFWELILKALPLVVRMRIFTSINLTEMLAVGIVVPCMPILSRLKEMLLEKRLIF